MIQYPVTFHGNAAAGPGLLGSWSTAASEMLSTCTIPSAFEGSGEGLTPEDHFLLAVQNCFVATFKVYAHYSKVTFETLTVKATLTVDKDSMGLPCMQKVHLQIDLQGVVDSKRALILVRKTLDNGFILRSVKTQIETILTINHETHAL